MPDDISPERIATLAAAARIALPPAAAQRIVGAVAPMLRRVAAAEMALELEIEPSTFIAVQHKDAGR
jgi:hypothetical protein